MDLSRRQRHYSWDFSTLLPARVKCHRPRALCFKFFGLQQFFFKSVLFGLYLLWVLGLLLINFLSLRKKKRKKEKAETKITTILVSSFRDLASILTLEGKVNHSRHSKPLKIKFTLIVNKFKKTICDKLICQLQRYMVTTRQKLLEFNLMLPLDLLVLPEELDKSVSLT